MSTSERQRVLVAPLKGAADMPTDAITGPTNPAIVCIYPADTLETACEKIQPCEPSVTTVSLLRTAGPEGFVDFLRRAGYRVGISEQHIDDNLVSSFTFAEVDTNCSVKDMVSKWNDEAEQQAKADAAQASIDDAVIKGYLAGQHYTVMINSELGIRDYALRAVVIDKKHGKDWDGTVRLNVGINLAAISKQHGNAAVGTTIYHDENYDGTPRTKVDLVCMAGLEVLSLAKANNGDGYSHVASFSAHGHDFLQLHGKPIENPI